jgi:hypothetical protein
VHDILDLEELFFNFEEFVSLVGILPLLEIGLK